MSISEIMLAASRGDAVAIRHLVSLGADVNAESQDGMTPLLWGIQKRRIEVVRLLIELGANTNFVASNGTPLIFFAITSGGEDIALAVVEGGVDVNARDIDGMTPLMHACMGDERLVPALLSRGAQVGAVDEEGNDALFWARKAGQPILDMVLRAIDCQ